ncbi:PREDICTED: eukaryotic translation initiation factor 4B3 [Theobroma cacao]|uniref:Eukaryotic translation initiation factor 4B3 n=2 Tax=Theobroma cacao TaxID=3641 RepID=A0AB32VYR5_THECC|nr:PREDICTED: eukaryotic translation initiation factor 4B3 [Theobroma cacao]EOX97749.1 Glycine-rich protein, putative [Theobroma cacao]
MAATVSSPWGKPGAWALDAEEHEAELQQQDQNHGDSSSEKHADFPSLATAAAAKTKKKKSQTLSLAEFTTYGAAKPSEPTRLTHEDLLVLPTGPRQRSPEELDRNRLGGGFKSYGSNRYNSNGDDSSSNGRWGSSRASNRDSNREIAPSRADEIDNWASAKKSTSTGNGFGGGFERRERGGGGFFDSQSKADEVDNWAANKSYKSANEAPPRRFGGGFERRSSFDSLQSRDSPRDLDNWGKKKEESGSAGSGGVRPRLVLQPRTVTEEGKKEATLAKPRGANPFGEARPREEVLKEKGKDWKEIDEKLEAVKIKETVAVTERGERGGKVSFGNGRAPVERSWRKSDSVEAVAADADQSQSSENGHVEEN